MDQTEKQKLLKKVDYKSTDLLKKSDEVLQRLDIISKDIREIKESIIQLDARLPERKSGWLGSYWDMNK